MRKFKIKNRRKRKYVKKHDLTTSLSQTQSLTVGLVPLVLMAIAFFATVFMYNPPVAMLPAPDIRFVPPTLPALPEVTIPQPELTITLPDLPEITIPAVDFQFTPPQLPQIVLPNVMSYVVNGFMAFVSAVDGLIQQLIYIMQMTAAILDPRPILISSGKLISSMAQQTGSALVSGFTITGQFLAAMMVGLWNAVVIATTTVIGGIQYAFIATIDAISSFSVFMTQLIVQGIQTVTVWIQAGIKATIDGWNAFIWFIGTPFRVVASNFNAFVIFMTPYYDFLIAALEQASYEFAAGGQQLVQGTSYVTETVATNQ